MPKSVSPESQGARLTERQFAAIGKVAVAWAFLEWSLHQCFCGLIGLQHHNSMFIPAKIRRVDVLIDIVRKLAPERMTDDIGAGSIDSLLSEVKELENSRNDIVHATWWGIFENPDIVEAQLMTRASQPPPMRKTAEEMEELAVRIDGLSGALMFTVFRDKISLPSSQKRSD